MFGNPRRTRVAVVIVGAANRSECFHGIVVAPCAGYLLADRVQAERFVILALPSGWGDEGKARKGPPRVDEDAGPGEVAFQAWVAFEMGLPNYRRARQAECGVPQRPADATGSWQTIEVIRGERALPPGNDQPVHDGEGDGRPSSNWPALKACWNFSRSVSITRMSERAS